MLIIRFYFTLCHLMLTIARPASTWCASKTNNKMALDSVWCALEVAFATQITFILFLFSNFLTTDIEIEKKRIIYDLPFNKEILSREERATVNLGRPVFRYAQRSTLKPRKHQPELNTSLINPASEHCVVVARARNCGSTTNIYCRNIDNSGSGVGKPFQLRRSENTSFWTNEDVENEGIKVGCVLEYRVLTCYQSPLGRYCKLGKRDGKQFIFHRNDRKPLLVSFH